VLCAATHGVLADAKMSHTPVPDVFPPGPPPGLAPPESTAPPSSGPPEPVEGELLVEAELLRETDPSTELPEAPDPSVELLVELLAAVPGDSDALEELLDVPPDEDGAVAELGLLDAPLDPDGPLGAPDWLAVPELLEVSEPPEFIDAGAADGAGLDEHPLARSAAETRTAAAHAPRPTGSPGLDSQPQMIRPFIFTPPSIRGSRFGSRHLSLSVRWVRRTCRWRIRPRPRCSSRPPSCRNGPGRRK
jgi:hypothetical protein